MLAATLRVAGDLDLAEECVQDAYAQALAVWPTRGVPARPGAWLTTVARRRALDLHRRDATLRRALPMLVQDGWAVGHARDIPHSADLDDDTGTGEFPDDRLRLICTCCHPALDQPAQIALTLRLVAGLTTAEVARAFLVSEATMAARLTRAKKKIATARIPYRVPAVVELPSRITAVLAVVHLLFTTGHSAPAGPDLARRDLVQRAADLARMLHALLPEDREVAGLLGLILLTDARRGARLTAGGDLVLLADQDRASWDRAAIDEGSELVRQALRGGVPGPMAVQAAIAAVHANAPNWAATDWVEIIGLYDLLVRRWPSPVADLNRAAAIGLAHGPAAGLAALDDLADDPRLATYPYLAGARADFLRRLGRFEQARTAYDEALLLTENDAERRFLIRRLTELGGADAN